MIGKWKAIEDYGAAGHAGCVGFATREDAIAWLQKKWNWNLCWYMSPAWVVEQY